MQPKNPPGNPPPKKPVNRPLPVLITAAGRSTRHPPNKLLQRLDGVPAICQTVAVFSGRADPLIVITGHDARRLTTILTRHHPASCTLVYNPAFRRGLSTSISAGIKALKNISSSVGFVNGDRPFIRRETVARMIAVANRHPMEICFPVYRGTPGQPIFFPRDLWPELARLTGEDGGRVVRRRYPRRCRPVSVTDPGVTLDLDRYLEEQC